MESSTAQQNIHDLRQAWLDAWPVALEHWSRFTKLSPPRLCLTSEEAKQEGLEGGAAMIRLSDQAVIIDLEEVQREGVEDCAVPILAHEIGHHVYAPGSLLDHGRMLARMRRTLPTRENLAPVVANLYTDLLINNRIQRDAGLNILAYYQKAVGDTANRAWTLYMRIYEILWGLPRASLAKGQVDDRLEGDAQLGARLIRSYARDWMDGSGRFAALLLPYLLEDQGTSTEELLRRLMDSRAGSPGGDALPGGLAEIEPGELEGAIHPADDPELSGLPQQKPELIPGAVEAGGQGRSLLGGNRKYREYRGPVEYGELLKSLGAQLSDHEITMRYYRERAMPHLVPFPTRVAPESTEPLPEGLDVWDIGQPLNAVDWLETVIRSPKIFPGYTTVERTYGTDTGTDPERLPVDLYLGIDCSGSMPNPQQYLSFPILAGTIIALSALRTGSRVMVVLSGEPGRSMSTDGFIRDEPGVLHVLTGYLGTGYAFGIGRLLATFPQRKPQDRPVHILLVTDHDIYSMLDEKHSGQLGWDVAREAAEKARAGATYVLHMPPEWEAERIARMHGDGWDVHCIQEWEDIVDFARQFSRAKYQNLPEPSPKT